MKSVNLIKSKFVVFQMEERSCEQDGPLSSMLKDAYSAEEHSHTSNHENVYEDSSSFDLFYDSLSDIQGRGFPHELSAFLSEEEVSKSLELAQESIMNSVEDGKAKQESTYYFNTSSPSSPEEIKVCDPNASKRIQVTSPNSLLIASQTLPEQKKKNVHSQEANYISSAAGKQSCISPLLPARPSFIRSLRHAEKCGPSVQKMSPKSTLSSSCEAPSKNKLCDKAATLIEELSSIFREAAKTRVRSPDGNSSSPDSGYLSPKNKQLVMSNSLMNSIPGKTCQEGITENELPKVTHSEESACHRKDNSQANENDFLNQLSKESQKQLSAPQFTLKLRSLEVAEGSKVLLECSVTGNPPPHVR